MKNYRWLLYKIAESMLMKISDDDYFLMCEDSGLFKQLSAKNSSDYTIDEICDAIKEMNRMM